MTRACTLCPALGARRPEWCLCVPVPRLCPACTEKHRCPALSRTLAEYRAANRPEADLTSQVIDALNRLPGVLVWQAKKRGQGKSTQAGHVLDVIGYAAPHGCFIGVETKSNHPSKCTCSSCKGQRAWAALLAEAGGIAVLDVRTVGQAVDGVRTALARRAA